MANAKAFMMQDNYLRLKPLFEKFMDGGLGELEFRSETILILKDDPVFIGFAGEDTEGFMWWLTTMVRDLIWVERSSHTGSESALKEEKMLRDAELDAQKKKPTW